jgi:hypothetical protein
LHLRGHKGKMQYARLASVKVSAKARLKRRKRKLHKVRCRQAPKNRACSKVMANPGTRASPTLKARASPSAESAAVEAEVRAMRGKMPRASPRERLTWRRK